MYKFALYILTISIFDFYMCSIAFTVESTSAGNCGPHLLPSTVNCSDSLSAAHERCCIQRGRDLIMRGTKNGFDSTFFVSLRQISGTLRRLLLFRQKAWYLPCYSEFRALKLAITHLPEKAHRKQLLSHSMHILHQVIDTARLVTTEVAPVRQE